MSSAPDWECTGDMGTSIPMGRSILEGTTGRIVPGS